MTRRFWVWACGLAMGLALPGLLWPAGWRWAGGVLGGAMLLGLSAWMIRDLVEGLMGRADRGGSGGGPGGSARGGTAEAAVPGVGWLLVKCFTRHAMLGLAAYGMMVRLQFDPVALVVGVTAPVAAVAAEAIRFSHRGS